MVSCLSAPSPGQTLAGRCNLVPGATCAYSQPRWGQTLAPLPRWDRASLDKTLPPKESSRTAHRLLGLLLARWGTKHHLQFLPQGESIRAASRANRYLPDSNLARSSGSLGSVGETGVSSTAGFLHPCTVSVRAQLAFKSALINGRKRAMSGTARLYWTCSEQELAGRPAPLQVEKLIVSK